MIANGALHQDKISLKFVLDVPIDKKSALARAMALVQAYGNDSGSHTICFRSVVYRSPSYLSFLQGTTWSSDRMLFFYLDAL